MPAKPMYHRWLALGALKYRGWIIANGEAPSDGDAVYPCPLCTTRKLFSKTDLDNGILTAEDVPPESVGGRKILLTCHSCNTSQGGRIDTHNKPREQFVDSLTGTRIWPVRGETTVGGLTARGDIYTGPGQVGFAYVKNRNNPAEREMFEHALRYPANIRRQFRLTPKFVWGQAELSVVRAAYLASFALFGWAHIFRDVYTPLRERLASATAPDLPPLVGIHRDGTPSDNKLFLVTGPPPFEGLLLVRIARWLVVMPGPDDQRTLEEAAAAPMSMPPVIDGKELDWPTKPEHWCDPHPPTERTR